MILYSFSGIQWIRPKDLDTESIATLEMIVSCYAYLLNTSGFRNQLVSWLEFSQMISNHHAMDCDRTRYCVEFLQKLD